jgi:hypothetical protein
MTVPVTLIGIIAAIVSNSRLVRSRKPGAQCRLLAPARERIAKT